VSDKKERKNISPLTHVWRPNKYITLSQARLSVTPISPTIQVRQRKTIKLAVFEHVCRLSKDAPAHGTSLAMSAKYLHNEDV